MSREMENRRSMSLEDTLLNARLFDFLTLDLILLLKITRSDVVSLRSLNDPLRSMKGPMYFAPFVGLTIPNPNLSTTLRPMSH